MSRFSDSGSAPVLARTLTPMTVVSSELAAADGSPGATSPLRWPRSTALRNACSMAANRLASELGD